MWFEFVIRFPELNIAFRCYGFLSLTWILSVLVMMSITFNFSTYMDKLYFRFISHKVLAAVNSGSFSFSPSVLFIHYSWFYNRGLDCCIQNSLYVFIWISFTFPLLPVFPPPMFLEAAVNNWCEQFGTLLDACEPNLTL